MKRALFRIRERFTDNREPVYLLSKQEQFQGRLEAWLDDASRIVESRSSMRDD